LGADFGSLVDDLAHEADPSIQQALILAMGDFDAGKMSNEQRQSMVERLVNLYRTNSDPGIHSAAAWTLRQWQEEETVKRLDTELRSASSQGKRNWFVNSQGQTFIVVNGPVEVLMLFGTQPKKVSLTYRFAVAAHEVTVAEFQRFRSNHSHDAGYAPQPHCPVNMVTWYDAVAYCNWLSQQEGITNDQWCYEPNDKGEYSEGMKISADFLERTGYRLPTEAEWEYACRAGTTTSYSFGEPLELLDRYAWYNANSRDRTWPVGLLRPNALGLFDMHGNVWEWCHDLFDSKNNDAVEAMVENRESRAERGGAWYLEPIFVRSAFRGDGASVPIHLNAASGFRPARTYP
jgi:eukaryotic-like serine/threonine-protein kinase